MVLEDVFWVGFNLEQSIGLVVVVGLDNAGSSTATDSEAFIGLEVEWSIGRDNGRQLPPFQ